MTTRTPTASAGPIDNAAFLPGVGAGPSPDFSAVLTLHGGILNTLPTIEKPIQDGRDARLFPGITLEFFTLGQLLIPVQRGEMVRESLPGITPSFWRVIPQIGRIWHDPEDAGWSRAAFPLMLVNDTDNHVHQGLALFLYRGIGVTAMRYQFVQQSAPFLLGQRFIAWGNSIVSAAAGEAGALAARRAAVQHELDRRLPVKPWIDLATREPAVDSIDTIMSALVRDGTVYFQPSLTPYGPYPYPLEMRFGVRSVMKSVGVPLSLLRLAQSYGPWVLTLRIGDYVPGLDPKWKTIQFRDAANMATGFGGTGSLAILPNDFLDGYLEGNYDAWYTAHSHADKLARINADSKPYPWDPGTVTRYRDQDFYLLGAALDAFLKSIRGPAADIWAMLKNEVFEPIGIAQAPAVRTREAGGEDGQIWFNAGYYPSLDDLAKIALLYQSHGEYDGVQLLHRSMTSDLLAARGALPKDGESASTTSERYQMGIHFTVNSDHAGNGRMLPSMRGFGGSEVNISPDGLVTIVVGGRGALASSDAATSPVGRLSDKS